MMAGLNRKEITKGMVVVIRYEGPKGGPGMPEMLTPTSAIMGAGDSDFPLPPISLNASQLRPTTYPTAIILKHKSNVYHYPN